MYVERLSKQVKIQTLTKYLCNSEEEEESTISGIYLQMSSLLLPDEHKTLAGKLSL